MGELIRVLAPGDEARVDAFLAQHADSSVILRSNLRAGGLSDSGKPYQMTWAALVDGEQVRSVVAHAWNGNLIFQSPSAQLEALARAAVANSGRGVKGLLGPAAQVDGARERLRLTEVPTGLRSTEDLFAIDTARQNVPEPLQQGEWS